MQDLSLKGKRKCSGIPCSLFQQQLLKVHFDCSDMILAEKEWRLTAFPQTAFFKLNGFKQGIVEKGQFCGGNTGNYKQGKLKPWLTAFIFHFTLGMFS